MARGGETIGLLLEDTGIAKALRFLDWFAFNIPRITTAVGVGLLAGSVGVHLYLLLGDFDWPTWLMARGQQAHRTAESPARR